MTAAPNSPTIHAPREAASLPSRDEFIRAHYRFQEGRFFTAVQIAENAVHCASDIAVPMWNHSAWFSESAPTAEFLRESEEWHTKHSRRPVIYSLDETSVEGYERFDRETWMVRDVSAETTTRADFHIHKATDLHEFTKVFRAAFSSALPSAFRLLPTIKLSVAATKNI
jgi:hypothetical protein